MTRVVSPVIGTDGTVGGAGGTPLASTVMQGASAPARAGQVPVSSGPGSNQFAWGDPSGAIATQDIRFFGAKLDTRQLSSISVNGNAVTAPGTTFLASDVGRTLVIYNNDGSGIAGQAVVTAWTDSGHVTIGGTITATALNTVTTGVIGTDDTAAWQAAITWGYQQRNGAQIVCSLQNAMSLVAGPQQTGTVTDAGHSTTYTYSGQLLLPAVATPGGSATPPIPSVEIVGTASPVYGAYQQQGTIAHAGGLVIVSSATTGNIVDVVSTNTGSAYGPGAFSLIQFRSTRVTWRTCLYKNNNGPGGLNLLAVANATLHEFSIDVDWPAQALPNMYSPGTATNAGAAVVLPADHNYAFVEMRRGQVVGYPKAIVANEHAVLDNVLVNACGAALVPGQLASQGRAVGPHGIVLMRLLAQRCGTIIEPLSAHSISGYLECETPYDNFITDPNGYLSGQIDVGGPFVSHLYVRSCSKNLLLRNVRNNPLPGLPSLAVSDTLTTRATGPTPAGTTTPFGLADSNHSYITTPTMLIDTTGAYGQPTSSNCSALVQNTPNWRSRHVSATIKTGTTSDAGIICRNSSSNPNNPLGIIAYLKAGTGVILRVSTNNRVTAGTVAANTTYTVDLYVRSSDQPGAQVVASVYLNGAFVLSYTLTAAEAAALPNTGNDGITIFTAVGSDDGTSRVTNLAITQATDLPYAAAGTATLVAGTVTVANTAITASSVIRVFRTTTGGTTGNLSVVLTAGTSFTINSSSGTDTSTIYYEIVSY